MIVYNMRIWNEFFVYHLSRKQIELFVRMGQLLRALKDGTPGGAKVDIFVDFESKFQFQFQSMVCLLFCLDAKPTESEKEIYDEVLGVLKIAPQLMQDMKGYGGGASVEIREVREIFYNCVRHISATSHLFRPYRTQLITGYRTKLGELFCFLFGH